MQVVGFHQARRPRLSAADKLRRGLSLPRPGGVIVCLVGAALVFNGALALAPDDAGPAAPSLAILASVSPMPEVIKLV